MNDYWLKYSQTLAQSLAATEVKSGAGEVLTMSAALPPLCLLAKEVHAVRGTIHFVGNGASACMASHMAVDWTKNAGVRALAYNDTAFLTAIGNDLGYDQVFAQPVSWFAEPGDLLVTISSSGNSPNVLNAIEAARQKQLRVVTFSGMKANNASRNLGDLNFFVPGWTYGLVECAHQVLLHAWLDAFMGVNGWDLTAPQVITPPVR